MTTYFLSSSQALSKFPDTRKRFPAFLYCLLLYCIVYSQGNREQPAHYLKQYKINAGDHSCFLKQTTSSRYNTKNFSYLNYQVRLTRQDYFKYSYFFKSNCPLEWPSIPQDLKCITLLTNFKSEIINFSKTKLEHYCLPGK